MKKKSILKPVDAVRIAKPLLQNNFKEHFLGLYLSARNKVIKAEVISMGTLDTTIVHPREVFRPAIVSHSASVILLHNHPSGDPEPSECDKTLTERLKKAGEILGFQILDHIIFTNQRSIFSFSDHHLI